jgi:hypothetical protein
LQEDLLPGDLPAPASTFTSELDLGNFLGNQGQRLDLPSYQGPSTCYPEIAQSMDWLEEDDPNDVAGADSDLFDRFINVNMDVGS